MSAMASSIRNGKRKQIFNDWAEEPIDDVSKQSTDGIGDDIGNIEGSGEILVGPHIQQLDGFNTKTA